MLCNGYNNKAPRKQQQELRGLGARALGGHQNAIENFAPFAVAVLFAHLTKVDSFILAKECVLFLAARIAFHFAYWLNLDLFRSFFYFIGYDVTLYLFALASLSFA